MNQLTEESIALRELAAKPALQRIPSYLRLSGPGWLQGAMTLGGGSAITAPTLPRHRGAVYRFNKRTGESQPSQPKK